MPQIAPPDDAVRRLTDLQVQARELVLHIAMRHRMREAFDAVQGLLREAEQVRERNARRELELALELASSGHFKDPATNRGARAVFVRLNGLCPAAFAAGHKNLTSDRLSTKDRKRSAKLAQAAARWELRWQSRDLPEEERNAMFADRQARIASKREVAVHWDLWVREPDDWQTPRDPTSHEPAELERFNPDEYLNIALYRLGGLADTGAGHPVVPAPNNTGDPVEDMRRYMAWRLRFVSSWDDARRPDPTLRPTRLNPTIAAEMLQIVRARCRNELAGPAMSNDQPADGPPKSRRGIQADRVNHVTPDGLRLLARSVTMHIRTRVSDFSAAAAWFASVPLLPTEVPPESVCPHRHKLYSAWVEVFRRFPPLPEGERYHGLSDEKCRRILLVLALAFDPDFDGHEVGLEPLLWDLPGQSDHALLGRAALWAAVSPDPATASWSDPVWGAVEMAVKLLGVDQPPAALSPVDFKSGLPDVSKVAALSPTEALTHSLRGLATVCHNVSLFEPLVIERRLRGELVKAAVYSRTMQAAAGSASRSTPISSSEVDFKPSMQPLAPKRLETLNSVVESIRAWAGAARQALDRGGSRILDAALNPGGKAATLQLREEIEEVERASATLSLGLGNPDVVMSSEIARVQKLGLTLTTVARSIVHAQASMVRVGAAGGKPAGEAKPPRKDGRWSIRAICAAADLKIGTFRNIRKACRPTVAAPTKGDHGFLYTDAELRTFIAAARRLGEHKRLWLQAADAWEKLLYQPSTPK